MSIKAKLVLKERNSPVTWSSQEADLFDLPVEGANYWFKRWAVKVERVVADRPPRVDLAHDWERDASFYRPLPADHYVIEAVRDETSGVWNARVIDTSVGRIVSHESGDDCDETIAAAVTSAVAAVARQAA